MAITVPTTLILGAGASYPYGFPTGVQLRRILSDELNGPGFGAFKTVANAGHSHGEILAFRNAFHTSQVPSIDEFLANNRPFWDVGKAAIAAVLIRREIQDWLLLDADARGPGLNNKTDHWYRYLWSRMDKSWDGFVNNDIRIVTFNYDRSLEMFLVLALSGLHSKGIDEARAKVAQLRILHVYGLLGNLGPIEEPGCRPYSAELDPRFIKIAANAIRVIPEHRDIGQDRTKIVHWIGESRRVCYLGFSYDPVNVERLSLSDAMPKHPGTFVPSNENDFRDGHALQVQVLGTTFGLKTAEQRTAAKLVWGMLGNFRDRECEEFLREYGVLL